MSTQHTEVTSTHWSAMFGSKESVSVGVSGEEEPASCIWHNSSSVMMSNTMSSGGLQSAFAPWPPAAGGPAWAGDGAGLGSPGLAAELELAGEPGPSPSFWRQARQQRSFRPPGFAATWLLQQ